jgi:hypothetical protein
MELLAALAAWAEALLRALSPLDYGLVLGAFLLLRISSRLGMWPYALLALPGTLAHELAHYLTALVLFAKPSFPSLLPTRTEHGWRLGSVRFRAGLLRSVPISLAPLMLLPLALVWSAVFLAPATWPWITLHAWLVATFLSACLPSRADFRIALPALALIAAIVLAWYLVH